MPTPRYAHLPLIAAFLVMAAFYTWTARTDPLGWRFGEKQTDYFNLLVDGFRAGQLSLKVDVPPALLQCPDPYDPAKRPEGVALHDTSLYRGKYYIYYGAVPAVVLLLPFRLLTGIDLSVAAGVLCFACASYLFALLLLADIRRRFFPGCGAVSTFLVGLGLGVASCLPLLLRRQSMYELPITCASCFGMAALYCLYRALGPGSRRTVWVALSSLDWGLAFGSRPTYLFASVAALLIAVFLRPEAEAGAGGGGRAGSGRGRLFAAAAAPIAAVGCLLALYNYLRFGDPTEYGVRYILSGVYESKVEHFRLRYLPWNFYAYLLSPGSWGRYFPFYQGAQIPLALPRQHYGMDFPFGLLPQVPFVWLVACVPLAWRARAGAADDRRRLRLFLVALAWTPLAIAGLLFCFYAAMARYLGDFAPYLALLAAIGALSLLERSRRPAARPWQRYAAAAIVGAGAAATLFTVGAGSVKIYDRLRQLDPAAYQTLARLADTPVSWLEALRGGPPGALTIQLRFPRAAPPDAREVLLATGWGREQDRVFVSYPDARHVQFAYEHAGAPPLCSEPLPLDRAAVHEVRLALGSLFPPETHPALARWSPEQRIELLRHLRVELDGRAVLDRHQRFYAASPGCMVVGGAPGDARFSGQLLVITRAPLPAPRPAARAGEAGAAAPLLRPDAAGVLRLRIRFPDGPAGGREPLVVTGETGRGDFLVVEYLGDHRLRFLLDHWGSSPHWSEPVAYVAGREYRLAIDFTAFSPARAARTSPSRGSLRVTLDGQPVWTEVPPFYAVDPDDIYVGYNPIGGSSCGEKFGGTIAASGE